MKPDITARELVKHLSNKQSQTGDVVGLLESIQEPARPKELSKQYSVDREVVHEVTEPLEPWAVERSNTGHREITTAGETARRAFAHAVETIDADGLAWLAWSENRRTILHYLHTQGPTSAKEISATEGTPTKKTVRGNFEGFEENGWVTCEEQTRKRAIVARLTMDGERTARVYDELLRKMEQVIDKAPCLRDLGLECADIPLEALGEAEMEEATPESPFAVEKRVRELSNEDFQHFRGFQSHWNGENAKAYLSAVKEGKEFEVISPPLGLDALPTTPDEMKCVVEGLRAENYQWIMHTDDLPCSLAVLDTDLMVVGPRDPSTANNERTGAVFAENDDLIEWAMDMYESHRKEGKDPFEVSVGFSIGADDLIELLRNRYATADDDGSSST
jgi:hypothetical protein